MNKQTIYDIPQEEYTNKNIILRVDFNCPMENNGEISDDTRIRKSLPTIYDLLKRNIKSLIIISHLGRPKGEKKKNLSLQPICERLSELIKKDVTFVNDFIERLSELKKMIKESPKGSIFLLENIRFYKEETSKDVDSNDVESFREKLTELGDIFVSDAFACVHRNHSSMCGIECKRKVAGLLMKKELDYFDKALINPKKPYLAILGGAKVDTKIGLIMNLLDKVDEMIIAGGMAYTFRKVLNKMEIGKSIYDEKGSKLIKGIMEKAKKKNVKIHLPVDWKCGDEFSNNAKVTYATVETGIQEDYEGLDIGEKSIENFKKVIKNGSTIIWNGPPGVFELSKFSVGSKAFIDSIAEATSSGATTIVCGGDSASCVNLLGSNNDFSHVSTGGGASTELISLSGGKQLPGFEILDQKYEKWYNIKTFITIIVYFLPLIYLIYRLYNKYM